MPTVAFVLLIALFATAESARAQVGPAQWTLSEEFRIGSVARQHYVLTEVSAVTRGSNGQIFVGQPMERQIRIYAASGRYLRSLGRRGRGPGEFESVDRLGWHNGAIYALDRRLRRLSLFESGGDVTASWGALSNDLPAPFSPYPPVAVLDDGSLLFRPGVSEALEQEVERVPLERFDSMGTYIDKIAWLSWKPSPTTVLRIPLSGGRQMISFVPNPVQHTTLWEVAPDGEWIVLVDRPPASGAPDPTFAITKLNSSGDTIFHRRFRYDAEEISENTWEDHERAQVEKILSVTSRMPIDSDEVRDRFESAYPQPRHQSVVDRLVAGGDGTVWLRRGSFGLEQATWLVLDGRGTLLATLDLPADLELHWASKDTVLGVIHDDLDVPYVVQYQVNRPRR